MNMAGFINKFTSKQRLTAMVVFGVVLVGLFYYNDSSEVAVAPPLVKQGIPVASAGGPKIPQGYEPGQIVRDPFAIPKEFEPAKPHISANGVPSDPGAAGRIGAGSSAIPTVNGIVGGDGRWMAVIQYGAESRSYKVQDYVGPYQVTAITSNTVTISGPGGRSVLMVGK